MKKKLIIIIAILVAFFIILLFLYVIYKLLLSPYPGKAPYENRKVNFTNKPDCISVIGPEVFINEISFINNCKKDIVINEIESDSKYAHYGVYIHKPNISPGILVDLSKEHSECPFLEKPLEGDNGIIGYKCNTVTINDGGSISVLGLNGQFRLSGDNNFIIEGKLD